MLPKFKNLKPEIRSALSDTHFRIHAEATELLIMEDIGKDMFGDGLAATDVLSFLERNDGVDINVRINSPGGLVYDGLVIYNALSQHTGKVTATIEGLAYSAASVIAMAADELVMHAASDIGIHRAWGAAAGNSAIMLDVAEWLQTIDGHLVDIYTAKTGLSAEQIEMYMDGTVDGTLFSAEKAVELGFADKVLPLKVKESSEPAEAAASQRSRLVRAEHQARLARIRKRHLTSQ